MSRRVYETSLFIFCYIEKNINKKAKLLLSDPDDKARMFIFLSEVSEPNKIKTKSMTDLCKSQICFYWTHFKNKFVKHICPPFLLHKIYSIFNREVIVS